MKKLSLINRLILAIRKKKECTVVTMRNLADIVINENVVPTKKCKNKDCQPKISMFN